MKKSIILILLIVCTLYFSCEKNSADKQLTNEISQEVIGKVKSLEMNPVGMISKEIINPDGTTESVYLIEKCLAINKDRLMNMDLHGGIKSEQYRTHNLVNNPYTIDVLGYTGGSWALTTKMQTALTQAIENYNNLNIGFNL